MSSSSVVIIEHPTVPALPGPICLPEIIDLTNDKTVIRVNPHSAIRAKIQAMDDEVVEVPSPVRPGKRATEENRMAAKRQKIFAALDRIEEESEEKEECGPDCQGCDEEGCPGAHNLYKDCKDCGKLLDEGEEGDLCVDCEPYRKWCYECGKKLENGKTGLCPEGHSCSEAGPDLEESEEESEEEEQATPMLTCHDCGEDLVREEVYLDEQDIVRCKHCHEDH